MTSTPHQQLRIGARQSRLARAQAELVAAQLANHGISSTFVPISTQGDVDSRQLTQIGGAGVFAGAVRQALLDDRIDVAVHSLKDLPTEPVDALRIIAYPPRDDARDVLVGRRLTELSTMDRVRIGTGAPRRVTQLQQLARDRAYRIRTEPIRGNVETRIGLVRSNEFDGIVLAAAGLYRLGLLVPGGDTVAGLPAELLADDLLLPAPGQGALAVEVADQLDSEICGVLTRLDSAATRTEVLAERRFLAVLGAGCTAPVGARAQVESGRDSNGDLTLRAVIGTTRGDSENRRAADDADHARPAQPGSGRWARAESAAAGQISIREEAEVVWLEGRGPAAHPQDLGHRLASTALARVDPRIVGR